MQNRVNKIRVGVAFCVALVGASPSGGQSTPTQLGRFSLQGFQGGIQIEFHDQRAVVAVGVNKPTPKPVPTREVQMWLLSSDGTVAPQLFRFPAAGEEARMAFEGGGSQLILSFEFEDREPVALVFGIAGEYQVFPIKGRPR
jgi:hypothetical protein